MERVADVAKWFLSKKGMTHKKLQKLCYYAQAWHCALRGNPLFEDDIQAWVHGPVVASLYPEYADYGWQKISPCDDEPELSDDAREVLEAVWNTYGIFDGDQLEALTHSEEPWIKARVGLAPWEICKNSIKIKDMKDFYLRKYEESQND